MPLIRPSHDGDLAAITAIYAHHVLHGTGTFEIDPPSAADMAARRAEVLARGLPWLVAEKDGQVLGFTYANWFKPRPAYRFSAEDSLYVADSARGTGANSWRGSVILPTKARSPCTAPSGLPKWA